MSSKLLKLITLPDKNYGSASGTSGQHKCDSYQVGVIQTAKILPTSEQIYETIYQQLISKSQQALMIDYDWV